MTTSPLTEEQRRRVHDHLYLVTRHLHRFARRTGRPTRDRELEDLRQEGCLGLIQAARNWNPDSGIPFEAYAVKRIHHEVSLALKDKFSTVRLPAPRRRGKCADPSVAPMPLVQNLEVDVVDRRSHAPDAPQPASESSPAFWERLESAVRRAGVVSDHRGRPDRADLLRAIIEHRLLIPDDRFKTPLRQLARQTSSSYGRVAACEKKLLARLKLLLESHHDSPS